jgi:type VI secretion system secreted protein Hcp
MSLTFYVTIKGKQQGQFKGESARAKTEGKIIGTWLSTNINVPRDGAIGAGAAGRRRHEPLVFRKDVGASTPQILQALCRNEKLELVLFEFLCTDPNGNEQVYFTIRMEDAVVCGHRFVTDEADDRKQNRLLSEEVSLTCRYIAWESKTGQTKTTDDWA